MQAYAFEYGPRPSGEGFGVVAESGNCNREDQAQLVAFCKAIRWSAEKREAPDQSCIALVPTPNVFWLCRIEEITDDQRRMAIRVIGVGRERSDDEAVRSLRLELIDAGIAFDRIPELDATVQPTILTHPELLRYERQPLGAGRFALPMPAAERHPLPMPVYDETAPKNAKGQPMKSLIMLLLGAVVAAFSLWYGYAGPAKERAGRMEADNNELLGQIERIEAEVQQWRVAAQTHFPGIASPDQLEKQIRDLEQKEKEARNKIELSGINLTDEQWKQLSMVRQSEELDEKLVGAIADMEGLRHVLPTQNNLRRRAEGAKGQEEATKGVTERIGDALNNLRPQADRISR